MLYGQKRLLIQLMASEIYRMARAQKHSIFIELTKQSAFQFRMSLDFWISYSLVVVVLVSKTSISQLISNLCAIDLSASVWEEKTLLP